MAGFTYWASGDAPEHEFKNGDLISVEEAQVLATLKVASELESLNAMLSDFTNSILRYSSLFPDNMKK